MTRIQQKIENLSANVALKHLDLSENEIDCLGDLSKLTKLKTLLLHCNKIKSLETASEFLPSSLCILSLAENRLCALTEANGSGKTQLLQPPVEPKLNSCANTGTVRSKPSSDSSWRISTPNCLPKPRNSRAMRSSSFGGGTHPTPIVGKRETEDRCPTDQPRATVHDFLSSQMPPSASCGAICAHLAGKNSNGRAYSAPLETSSSVAWTNASKILRSDSIFIPIDVIEEVPQHVVQTASVDDLSLELSAVGEEASEVRHQIAVPIANEAGLGDIDSTSLPTSCRSARGDGPHESTPCQLRFSTHFLKSLTALSQELQPISCVDRPPSSFADSPEIRSSADDNEDSPAASRDFCSRFSMDEDNLNRKSIQTVCEDCSLRSERTFVDLENVLTAHTSTHLDIGSRVEIAMLHVSFVCLDPFHAHNPEHLEADLQELRRELQAMRELSARQEEHRRRQAGDIRRLAREVRQLKAWQESLQHSNRSNQSWAGDAEGASSTPRHSGASPSLSTLVAANPAEVSTSGSIGCLAASLDPSNAEIPAEASLLDATKHNISADELRVARLSRCLLLSTGAISRASCEPDELVSATKASTDDNATLLTANISADSLDSHQSQPQTLTAKASAYRQSSATVRL
ncbi:unnamed protein product [Mesocestoides corti]|uniref:U2A'/phosphoprotein 32 family A C-terminal domain-containing protein n=1 Tax=Mesocestoides corti TaxID=53468 RepID=A0A0R3UAI6_MESCO|nr:unnamed protein product [Mesocestoides corti]